MADRKWVEALIGGMPHCKRCKVELEGDEQACPRCGFEPRETGFRLSGFGMLVLIGSMIGAQISLVTLPGVSIYFLLLAVLGFVFALSMFLLSLLVTPYRFGGLFIRN